MTLLRSGNDIRRIKRRDSTGVQADDTENLRVFPRRFQRVLERSLGVGEPCRVFHTFYVEDERSNKSDLFRVFDVRL